MKRKSIGLIALFGLAIAIPAQATDHGHPTFNTLGRYFGVGWSHHSYHSHVNGRFDMLDRRHPASDYYSRALNYPYSPYYNNYPPLATASEPAASYWTPPNGTHSPIVIPTPTLAPRPMDPSKDELGPNTKNKSEEVPSKPSTTEPAQGKKPLIEPVKPKPLLPKPAGPPPDWLKPFLDSDSEAPRSEVEDDNSELIELQPSPSDRPELKEKTPKSASLPGSAINRYTKQ